MAILSCFTVYSTATAPKSQDSPPPPPDSIPNPLRTKILLPKKKPMKWTTGVAPGEYGGPPTTTKLRKYWGGNKEDPVTSSDFIWNRDFMPDMEKLVEDRPDPDSPPQNPTVAEESPGFLSLGRAMSLDSLEVDLSASLTPSPEAAVEHHAETAEVIGVVSRKWRPAPTRREQDKWDRATKATTGGSDVLLREVRKSRADPKVLAAQSREQYNKLKKKMQVLTLGIGGIGLVSAYVSYTPEIAASFGVGLIGSLIYIRMLGNTVDSMANPSLMKGAAGQPRLLVPAALVMIYNRWNEIAVPEFGLMHLELIPMLVGFFTYKIATFAQAIEEAVFPGGRSED